MKKPLGSPTNPGVPQIQDEEWEKWRDVLIHLYLENGVKLKDIVRIMAENKFVVTERQLKYRFFQKWDVKKNIKSHDLPMLSSTIDKQREAGQDVRIEYHGRDIGQDRIERASKRCRTTPPPSSRDLSSPFGVSFSLDQRFALASETLDGDQTGFDHFSKVSSRGEPVTNEYSADGGLQAVDDNAMDVVCGLEGIGSNDELVSGRGSFCSMLIQEDLGQILPNTSHLDLVSQYAGLAGASSTEPMDVDVDWSLIGCAPTGFNAATARRSLNCVDLAWAMSPEYFPDIQRNGDDMIADMIEQIHLQPRFESPMPSIAPLQLPYSRNLQYTEGSVSPDTIMDGLEVDLVAADGHTFETTIPPLENLLTYLLLHRSDNILFDVHEYSWEVSGQPSLQGPIGTDQLTIEIEDLLCWIVSSCQRAVAQGQVHKETFDGQGLLSILIHKSSNRNRLFPANRAATRGQTLIEASKFGAPGMLRLELSIAGSGRYPVASDVISVCSIPHDQQRTTGLMASFALNAPSFGARISPHIKTFNVVPIGSPVIQCVKKHDLEGVQKLFAKGRASPLDVDPKGNSLLQYAMLGGDSAVFRFLLHCGAGIQTFRYSDYEADFVWTLWTHYMNYVRVPGAPRIGPNRIEDFSKCTRMTDAVFESGYDLDEGPYCHPYRPNLLFELACDGGHAWQKRSTIVEALQYLVRKGYDMEERNCEGDTPLLYAAKAYRSGAVTHIEAFAEAGSDTSATNLAGQGPLHCALVVPEAVLPADWNVQENDKSLNPGPLFYEYRIIYSTFHDGPEGYRCHADHICWLDTNGVSRRMRNPIQVLKERSKFKILVLLNAGCDPNLPDRAGESPSHYAERNGLFPQWKWALIKNGYMLDEKSGRWIK